MRLNVTDILVGREDVEVDPPHGVIGCPDCGLISMLPRRVERGVVHCRRCDSPLERTAGRSIDAALACSFATFVLLFPANLLPALKLSLLGAVNQSLLISGVIGTWNQGWPVLAIVVGIETIVLPFARFGLLTAVLLAIRLKRRGRWLGPAFRYAEALDEWAMIDVFLFGAMIGYERVAAFLPVTIEAGGLCVIATALLTLVTRASLERRAIWRAIAPDARALPPDALACTACDMVVPGAHEGDRCPRCRERLFRSRPFGTMRALALAFAGFALYPIAYLYPMEISERIGMANPYTIMTGVFKLLDAGLWFFAVVIFVASVMIPLLKLFALSWFAISVHHGSTSRLRLKTRLHRLVKLIGRWSHIDPFTVTVFMPILHLPGYLAVLVGKAMPAFLAVVVVTMFAADLFDSRALWARAVESGKVLRTGEVSG
jgi:paraquat-inducible protein A